MKKCSIQGFLLFSFCLSVWATPAHADVYMYVDKNGVAHFTNIRPRGRKYRRLYKTGPGKASTRHCPSCDRIPARDHSPERFRRYDDFIRSAARLYQIPVALIRAVIEVESDFDPRVVSSVGAKGLMQLMPGTARSMGVTDVGDPRQNIYGGVRYLRVLANTFNGNLLLTVAGYHAGPTAVARYRGVPPYETTQRYVRAVLRLYARNRRQASAAAARLRPRAAGSPPRGGAPRRGVQE